MTEVYMRDCLFSVEFPDGEGHSFETIGDAVQAIADEAFRQNITAMALLELGCKMTVPYGYDVSSIRIPDPIRLSGSVQKTPHLRCTACNGSSFSKVKGSLACEDCYGTGVAGEKTFRKKKLDKKDKRNASR